jgi:hypothetical protein
MFSSDYADTIEVITGSRDMLDQHSKAAGPKFLKLKHLDDIRPSPTAQPEGKQLADKPAEGPPAVGGAMTTINIPGLDFGTVSIPGLDAAQAEAEASTAAGTGAPTLASMAAMAQSMPGPRKTLKDILSEHRTSHAPPKTGSSKPDGGDDKKGDKGNAKGSKVSAAAKRFGGGGAPPAREAAHVDGGAGLTGMAALRARFEKK